MFVLTVRRKKEQLLLGAIGPQKTVLSDGRTKLNVEVTLRLKIGCDRKQKEWNDDMRKGGRVLYTIYATTLKFALPLFVNVSSFRD